MFWQLELHDNYPLGNQKNILLLAGNITLQKYKTRIVISVGVFLQSIWLRSQTGTNRKDTAVHWTGVGDLLSVSDSTTEYLGFWNITVMMSTMSCYVVFLDSVSGGETISHYVFVPCLTQGGPIFMLKLTLFTLAAKPLTEKGPLLPSSSSKHILFFCKVMIIFSVSVEKLIRSVRITVKQQMIFQFFSF